MSEYKKKVLELGCKNVSKNNQLTYSLHILAISSWPSEENPLLLNCLHKFCAVGSYIKLNNWQIAFVLLLFDYVLLLFDYVLLLFDHVFPVCQVHVCVTFKFLIFSYYCFERPFLAPSKDIGANF